MGRDRLYPHVMEFLKYQNLLTDPRATMWTILSEINTEESAVQAAFAWGLIPSKVKCPACRTWMTTQVHETNKLGFRWRCRKTIVRNRRKVRCGKLVNPLKGTFFERSHLRFVQILRLLCHFVREDKIIQSGIDVGIDRKTAIDFFSFFRETCDLTQDHDFKKLGSNTNKYQFELPFYYPIPYCNMFPRWSKRRR